MTHAVCVVLACVCAVGGGVLVFAPGALPWIESMLNRRWEGGTVFAIRLGLDGERAAEERLNRPVLDHAIYWDGWIRRHPRAAGLAVLCFAAALAVYARIV